MKNAKRVLSVVLCVLMTISMLTAIVLPVSADVEDPAPVADAYEKVTTIEGTDKPTENVFFFDAAWAMAAPATYGAEFAYTYAGNGKTYTLTYGINALGTMVEFKTAMENYSIAWSANTDLSQDFVAVFAAGNYGGLDAAVLSSTAGTAVPSIDQMLNVYMLGVNAGKNPVNDARANADDVKVVQNGRSDSALTESLLSENFTLPSKSNITIDGFAGNNNISFVVNGANQYVNVKLHNIFVRNLVNPADNALYNATNESNASMWEFKNCYFDYNLAVNNSTADDYQLLYSVKTTMENCALINGTPATGKYGSYAHWMLTPSKTNAAKAAAFFGEYAEKPELTVNNCVSADWKSRFMLHMGVGNARVRSYANGAVTFNVTNNRFYECIGPGLASIHTSIINLGEFANVALAAKVNIIGNIVTASDAVKNANSEVYLVNLSGKAVNAATADVNIRENIFACPNETYQSNRYSYPVYTASGEANCRVDLSSNLFMDKQGHVVANWQYNTRSSGAAAQSDVYVSAAMKGGVREVLSVKDIKGGALLYSYITLNMLTAYAGGKPEGASSHAAYAIKYEDDYFMGAVTVLLERGKTYNTDEMFVFGDPNTVFEGVYATEEDAVAGVNEIKTLTQDDFKNGKKFFMKASYSEEANGYATTATVVFGLNSPTNYFVVTPEGSDYASQYTFNGITYTNGAVAEDGVKATFSNAVTSNLIAAQKEYVFADKQIGSANMYGYNTVGFCPASFCMESMILLTPGKFTVADPATPMLAQYTHAIVGPNWLTSPYGEGNAEGQFAGGRSLSEETEAVLDMTFHLRSGYITRHNAYYGVVFTNETKGAIMVNGKQGGASQEDSDYGVIITKNCIFNTPVHAIGTLTNLDGKAVGSTGYMVDVRVQDCVYYGLNFETTPEYIFALRANKKVAENIAVMTKDCAATKDIYQNYFDNKAGYIQWKNVKDFETSGVVRYAETHTEKDTMIVEQEPSCYQAGKGYYECVCGNTITRADVEIPATEEHSFATEWTKDETGHYYVCTNDGCTAKDQYDEHTESEVIVDKAADCGNAGKGHIDCTVCGYAIDEDVEIAATGNHSYGDEWVEVTPPSFAAPGQEKKTCSVCGNEIFNEIPQLESAAVIGGKEYTSFAAALAEAKEGDVIRIGADVTEPIDALILDEGITVNLNGHTLEVGYYVGFEGSAIIDTKGNGKLIVAKNKVALNNDNGGYLPVYDGDGYVFTDVNLRTTWMENASSTYAFSPIFDEFAHNSLASGYENSGVKVVVRISWADTTYTATKDFVYNDGFVEDVMDSYGKVAANDYGLAFTAAMKGTLDPEVSDFVVSAVLISDTGVEIESIGSAYTVELL